MALAGAGPMSSSPAAACPSSQPLVFDGVSGCAWGPTRGSKRRLPKPPSVSAEQRVEQQLDTYSLASKRPWSLGFSSKATSLCAQKPSGSLAHLHVTLQEDQRAIELESPEQRASMSRVVDYLLAELKRKWEYHPHTDSVVWNAAGVEVYREGRALSVTQKVGFDALQEFARKLHARATEVVESNTAIPPVLNPIAPSEFGDADGVAGNATWPFNQNTQSITSHTTSLGYYWSKIVEYFGGMCARWGKASKTSEGADAHGVFGFIAPFAGLVAMSPFFWIIHRNEMKQGQAIQDRAKQLVKSHSQVSKQLNKTGQERYRWGVARLVGGVLGAFADAASFVFHLASKLATSGALWVFGIAGILGDMVSTAKSFWDAKQLYKRYRAEGIQRDLIHASAKYASQGAEILSVHIGPKSAAGTNDATTMGLLGEDKACEAQRAMLRYRIEARMLRVITLRRRRAWQDIIGHVAKGIGRLLIVAFVGAFLLGSPIGWGVAALGAILYVAAVVSHLWLSRRRKKEDTQLEEENPLGDLLTRAMVELAVHPRGRLACYLSGIGSWPGNWHPANASKILQRLAIGGDGPKTVKVLEESRNTSRRALKLLPPKDLGMVVEIKPTG